ncbi:hypothetical protein P0G10_21030, partial [Eubacteriales bacterium DFI.9.88]|nr:hypothetical protein [Eubacteriales bacterium DFI.9.88]
KRKVINTSHPIQGAWIEIQMLLRIGHAYARRIPYGVRGLKLKTPRQKESNQYVASHTGCVD